MGSEKAKKDPVPSLEGDAQSVVDPPPSDARHSVIDVLADAGTMLVVGVAPMRSASAARALV